MKDLVEVINEFLNSASANDGRRILEQHPELLSEEADSMLDTLLKDARSEEDIDLIQHRRNFLAHCHEVGIDQAFEEISSSYNEISGEDLQMMLDKIASLSRPHDIPVKIEMIQQVLSLIPLQLSPELWAALHNDLSISLIHNPLGNRAENIEKSIEYYNQALKVYTYNDFPMEWAKTQNNLAVAYLYRIRGDRADNIEKAIECCNQTLKVRTYHDFPMDWAGTQCNLGFAYSVRIKGDRAENIENTIEYCNQALRVYSQEDFPVQWAMIQNNLGIAYFDRIQGDKAENIEKAIEYYNQTLTVRTYHDLPMDWAGTLNNLALAYCDRIRGVKGENIEKAIEYCNQALKVYKYHDFSVEWAKTQNNLGFAYSRQIGGDKAENIEKAIEHYNQALKVRTYHDFPMDWAKTQSNLGSAYLDRIQGDKAENIEQAIKYYNQSLWVRTYQEFPIDWAVTQNNLALAYKDRIRGDSEDNFQKAITHYLNALNIFKLETMPNNFRNVCRNLGNLYFNLGRWKDALESFKDAIKAGDLLYRSGLSAESKNFEVKENEKIYKNASLAACHLGLEKDGLMILERGKTRLLNDVLQLKMKQPEAVPNHEWIKYEQAAEKYRIVSRFSDLKEDYAQREEKIQKILDELDTAIKIVQTYDPEFQKELNLSDIFSLLDEETALLTICITDKGSIGFVVSRLNGVESIDIPNFKSADLDNLLFNSNEERLITGGWVGDYLSYINASRAYNDFIDQYEKKAYESKKQLSGAYILYSSAFHKWQQTSNEVLSSIAIRLFYPMLEKLPPQSKRLIIIPSGGLFLLPLHAIPLLDGQLLCQRYITSYSPSISLYREMKNKAENIRGNGFYAVIKPQEDRALVFSICEGQSISKLFKYSQVNVGETGTRATVLDRIPGHEYLHFSCHGNYNWNDPPQSGVSLVGGRTLSLADLQNDVVDMSSARLVTLSACETGITDVIKGSADEYVGLPAGFMLAGVPCVVSSLWSVPDISTALLMEQFYFNHVVGGMDIPMALHDAQLWVRDLTFSQVKNYVEKCYLLGKWEGESKEFVEQYRKHYLKIAEESPDEKPFQHPYYWAAFTVNGA